MRDVRVGVAGKAFGISRSRPKSERSNRLRYMNGPETALDEAYTQKAGYRPIFNSCLLQSARNPKWEASPPAKSKASKG